MIVGGDLGERFLAIQYAFEHGESARQVESIKDMGRFGNRGHLQPTQTSVAIAEDGDPAALMALLDKSMSNSTTGVGLRNAVTIGHSELRHFIQDGAGERSLDLLRRHGAAAHRARMVQIFERVSQLAVTQSTLRHAINE